MNARALLIATVVALAPCHYLTAQSVDGATASKRIIASRSIERPHIDGRLDESAWSTARFVSDFTQKDPLQGAEPSERTELAVLFDDDAIYVGARMHRRDASRIHRAVTRRDDVGNTERIIVALDTYHDRRTAYSFAVTAAGGIADYYHSGDDEFDRDYSFNPVWQAETTVDAEGWSMEMRIPFSQLRFNDAEHQVWGINIDRWIPDLNEDIYWVMIPKESNGWASRFGELVGLEGVRPSVRLELLPYVATDVRIDESDVTLDPFEDHVGGRAGLDLKMGLGPNLTLDATINPDFGQVEADPAQVNLSDFESVFDERRPFFVEGAQLLGGGGARYFYSRRIGAPPHGAPGVELVEAPENTTILAASKLTGRLPSGLSVGALTAVTEREHGVQMLPGGTTGPVEVEPLTAYGVVRMQQELGEDHSTVGVIGTIVDRAMEQDSPLRRDLADLALTGGLDYAIRFDGGAWQLDGFAGASHVRGDPSAMLRLQSSSARYFGRPDADYVEIDSTRSSLTGYAAMFELSKNAGRWQGELGRLGGEPELELNDLGQLSTADDIDAWVNASYSENEPGELLRSYRIGASVDAGWNFGGVNTYRSINADFNVTLLSFWSVNGWGGMNLPSRSDNLSRGGPLMGTALGGYGGVSVNSPYTDRVRGWLQVNASGNAIGGWSFELYPGVRAELSDQVTVELTPTFSRSMTPRQYVATIDSGGERTYGRRYVFARIDQAYLSAQLRLSYVITPHLSLDLYAEPFAGTGRFYDYGELPEPGSTEIRRYETSGGAVRGLGHGSLEVDDAGRTFEVRDGDFAYRSFRANLVLRWEWLPGSTAYFVWQRNAEDYEPSFQPLRARHVGDAITATGDQVVAIKVAWWLPVD